MEGIYAYWGKAARDLSAWHLLPYHCLDVAAVGHAYLRHDELLCQRTANLLGIEAARVPDTIAFLLSLHDIGKFSENFQSKVPALFRLLRGRDAGARRDVGHDTIGSWMWERHISRDAFLCRLLPGEEKKTLRALNLALSPLFSAVIGHHGRPPGPEDASNLFSADDLRCAGEFVSRVAGLFSVDGYLLRILGERARTDSVRVFSWPLAGLCVLADWIASNHELFPFLSGRVPLGQYWVETALTRAEKALWRLSVLPLPPAGERDIGHLFPAFATGRYTPSDLQEYASRARPGPGPHLYIIEDTTGSGKTEAAITLAHHLAADGCGHGLYFALPTMATSNAMYGRIRDVRGRFFAGGRVVPVILAHSARQLLPLYLRAHAGTEGVTGERDEEDVSLWLADNRKKALLAALGVGTVDQALAAVLPRRHQSLRLFGLWRNVLVVDEVHAYDPYVNEFLRNLVSDHARIGGSTILLSATLPVSTRNELVRAFCDGAGIPCTAREPGPYPLVTHVSRDGCEEIPLRARPGTEREVPVVFSEDEEDVIAHLLSAAQSGRCACWIRNTVRDAIGAYRALANRGADPFRTHLFHARYILGHRLEVENEVLRLFGKESTPGERSGRILVATQVVEQSLDIDFDVMVTDLAPIDLVIQRSGRLHRHPRGERGKPVLGIHAPPWDENPGPDWYASKFPAAARVYAKHGELWLTMRILREKGAIRIPGEARELVEGVYGVGADSRIPAALAARDREFDREARDRGVAMTNVINFTRGYTRDTSPWPDDEDVPTRLAEPQVTLRLGTVDREGETVRPLFDAGEYSWEMSQVSVRRAEIGGGIGDVRELGELIESARATMRDKGRGCILVPLVQRSDNHWENTFPRNDGKQLRIQYTREEGLLIDES
ncbi:MAG: CRISPR-associated helicase Cas3' [Methanolinea sp.]|nr:CRISPR-associated helicase Cas3' [Methanolinea sp.]